MHDQNAMLTQYFAYDHLVRLIDWTSDKTNMFVASSRCLGRQTQRVNSNSPRLPRASKRIGWSLLVWTSWHIGLVASVAKSEPQMPWTSVHQWTSLAANITIVPNDGDSDFPNFSAVWRILHITDAHISLAEATDLHDGGTRRMHRDFRSMTDKHIDPGRRREPKETFKRLIGAFVRDSSPDVVVLGGDIVNFPHNASVQFVLEALIAAGCGIGRDRIPVVYTAGNHDWLVEGLPTSRLEQRTRFRHSVLRPFYRLARSSDGSSRFASATPSAVSDSTQFGDASVFEIVSRQQGGNGLGEKTLLLLTLDTSALEVSSAQAAFIWRQLARGIPALLVVHVPLMVPGATPVDNKLVLCGDPRYNYDGDTSWQIEKRERWPVYGAPAATAQFMQDLVQRFVSPRGPLLGVVSGHEHLHRADVLGQEAGTLFRVNCQVGQEISQCERQAVGPEFIAPDRPSTQGFVQYVSLPAFEGGHRLLEVRDLRSYPTRDT